MDDTFPCHSRRALLRGLGVVGVAVIAPGVLVACGSGRADGQGADAEATGGATAGAGEATGAGEEVSVPLADVPVGQAVVVDSVAGRFVVAQPADGEVVAFSATCTHQGTPVVADGGLELRCPNHGSRFAGADGAVLQGPATEPLTSVDARVDGDQVVLAV